MENKLKKQWVKALKSKKFKQGDSYLYNEETDTHCCLGVLCEVLLKNKDKKLEKVDDHFVFEENTVMGGRLDNDLMEHVGITEEQHNKLIHLNDEKCQSFKRIAKHIKNNF